MENAEADKRSETIPVKRFASEREIYLDPRWGQLGSQIDLHWKAPDYDLDKPRTKEQPSKKKHQRKTPDTFLKKKIEGFEEKKQKRRKEFLQSIPP